MLNERPRVGTTLYDNEGKAYTEEVLVRELEIYERLDQIASWVDNTYQNKNLLIICVLKGAYMTTAELTKRITLDDMVVDFMKIRSYGGGTESNRHPKITLYPDTPVNDRNVLVVDDIADTRRTLKTIATDFKQKGVKSLKVVTLLDKPERQEVDAGVEIVSGFKLKGIPWVEGFGMDTDELNRNLPYIVYRKYAA